jgi:hypothetical protein
MADEEIQDGESREEKLAKLRRKYKKPMGCLMKLAIGAVVIVVLLAIGLTLYFQFFWKPGHQDKSFGDFWQSMWHDTKDTVAKVKDKALEWKDWLLKSENTRKWLDKAFPVREAARAKDEKPAETPEGTGPAQEGEPAQEEQPAQEEKAGKPEVHPELQAAADEFRAGLALFRNRENNRALERFRKAQDHLESYRKVNPNDPQIEEFEKELTPFIQAAVKDSTVE